MLPMSTFVSPQIFLVSLLAGWLNREQQKILDYLQEENRVLREQMGGPVLSKNTNGLKSRANRGVSGRGPGL